MSSRGDTRIKLLLFMLGVVSTFTALTARDTVLSGQYSVQTVSPGVERRVTRLDNRLVGTFLLLLPLGLVSGISGATCLVKDGKQTTKNIALDFTWMAGNSKNFVEEHLPLTAPVLKVVTEISTSYTDQKRSLQILAQAPKTKRLTIIAGTGSGKTFTMNLLMWLRNANEQRGTAEKLPLYIFDIKFGDRDRTDKTKRLTWGDYHKVNPHAVRKRVTDIRAGLNSLMPPGNSSPALILLPELNNLQTLEGIEKKSSKLPGVNIGDCVSTILTLGDSYDIGIWTDAQTDLVGSRGSDTRVEKSNETIILGSFTHDIAVLRNVLNGYDKAPEDVANTCKGLIQSGYRPFVYLDIKGCTHIGCVPYMPNLLDRKWELPHVPDNPYDTREKREQITQFIREAGKVDCKTACASSLGLINRSSPDYKELFTPVFEDVVNQIRGEFE